MRKYVIAGNWKMNKVSGEAKDLVRGIVDLAKEHSNVEIVVCPTYTALSAAGDLLEGTNVKLGAQDVHWEESGAFTGKVSTAMLKDLGVEYVIIGHSEQRQYFHETDETVNKKVKKALEAGLIPIICVGETIEERKAEQTKDVVKTQISGAYDGISAEDAQKTIIAYEPVWAIGTGLTATSDQAQEIHAFIRELLTESYGAESAESIRIQYGGSMKPENAEELLAQKDVDGGLIGGASLKPDSFIGIISAAKN